MVVNIIDVRKLVRFSTEEGRLDTMEKRRGAKRDLLRTGNFNIVLVCLEKGQEIPARPEPYEVCFYVIEGRGIFTVGEKRVGLGEGSMILVPADIARGIRAEERMSMLGIQEPH